MIVNHIGKVICRISVRFEQDVIVFAKCKWTSFDIRMGIDMAKDEVLGQLGKVSRILGPKSQYMVLVHLPDQSISELPSVA